ncbi:MAG: hypothetical protein IT289_12965 [Oligoflexia bacterium]|nr:hypothetical protein [Oligoflexia bacterium]
MSSATPWGRLVHRPFQATLETFEIERRHEGVATDPAVIGRIADRKIQSRRPFSREIRVARLCRPSLELRHI